MQHLQGLTWIKSLLAQGQTGEEVCEAGPRRWDVQKASCNGWGPSQPLVLQLFFPFSLFLEQEAMMHHVPLDTWTPEFPTSLLTLGHQWLRTTCRVRAMPASPWLSRHLLCMAVLSPEQVTMLGVTQGTAQ